MISSSLSSPSHDNYLTLFSFGFSDVPEINETSSLLRGRAAMKDKLSMYAERCKNRRFLVDLWAIFFGIGAWVGVNSVYLQLPLFVNDAPEGWSLPSYFVVITQLGNVGPLLYTAIQKCRSFKDSYMIYALMFFGTAASILMAFFYKETVTINNAERSVPMFVLVFFLALVGCTSSVLYMPYMGRFRDIYLISYLIGEGLSGFIPSVVALIQGVGGNAQCIKNNSTDPNDPEFIKVVGEPRFGTDIFYIFVFILFILSYISFIFLDKSRISTKEHAAVTINHGNSYTYADKEADDKPAEAKKELSTKNYYYLLFLIGVMCMFGNGIIPSVQSYSCLPYGNVAYHLTVTLSSIANPVACFMAVFLPHTSIRTITYLSILSGVFCSYALATAFLSPQPPLMGMLIGDILVVSMEEM